MAGKPGAAREVGQPINRALVELPGGDLGEEARPHLGLGDEARHPQRHHRGGLRVHARRHDLLVASDASSGRQRRNAASASALAAWVTGAAGGEVVTGLIARSSAAARGL